MNAKTKFALYFAVISSMLGLGLISPFLPHLAHKMGAGGFLMGLMFSGFAISRSACMPIVGDLSDKVGRKIFIVLGLGILVVASVCYPFAYNVFTMICVRLLHGVAAGMIVPVSMAYAGETVREGKEGVAMGFINLLFLTGTASGPFIGGIIGHHFGINPAFYFMTVISSCALVLVILLMPKDSHVGKVDLNSEKELMDFKMLLKKPLVIIILLIMLLFSFRTSILLSFFPSLSMHRNINQATAGILISSSILLSAFLSPVFGRLADAMKRPGQLILLISGSFIASIALFLIPLCPNIYLIFMMIVVLGIGAGISYPIASGLSVLIGKEVGMGHWMGIFNTVVSIGIIISPLTAGLILDISNINMVFYFFGCICFLGSLLSIPFAVKKSKSL